ncbi:MAG: hypothetical protein MUE68_03360 [Bacteroidetes bacterium]|jgi:hypothetical protein|nr:hypothetical protein [Bacteroidota bacterium]
MNGRGLDIVSGGLIVSAGLALFLRALDVQPEAMVTVAWSCASVLCGIHAVIGLIAGSNGRKFWGALGFVAAGQLALWSADILTPTLEESIAAASLWVGLAFAFVWLSQPYKLDVLAVAVLFGGPGVGYYLWWHELVDLRLLERWAGSGWPAIIILAGAGLILRAFFKPTRQ